MLVGRTHIANVPTSGQCTGERHTNTERDKTPTVMKSFQGANSRIPSGLDTNASR